MLPSEISKTPHRPTSERVSWCLETSPLLGLLPREGSPSLTLLSLFLSFIFCPASFRRHWAAFLGASCPPPVFRWSFDEFVGEKVFFLSCSSAILICIFFFDTTQNLTQGGFLKTSCNVQSESHQWSFCSLLNWKFIDLSCTLAVLHMCGFVTSYIGKQRDVSYWYFYTIKKSIFVIITINSIRNSFNYWEVV